MTHGVEVDLEGDFVDFCLAELDRIGYATLGLDARTTVRRFFSVRRRLVSMQPRKVIKANKFPCPPQHLGALAEVERRIVAGDDITPYLSRQIRDIHYQDGLLNHWGLHHLHLGDNLESDGFAERTNLLVFARFSDEFAYFLAVLPHRGAWTLQKLIEISHANFPASLKRYRQRGAKGTPLTDQQVSNLRGKNVNHTVTVPDGTVYLPPGGGVASSGDSALDTFNADGWVHWARREQQRIVDDLDNIRARAAASGHPLPDRAEFKLDMSHDPPCAVEITSRYALLLIAP